MPRTRGSARTPLPHDDAAPGGEGQQQALEGGPLPLAADGVRAPQHDEESAHCDGHLEDQRQGLALLRNVRASLVAAR